MRTTLSLADDVLAAARVMADAQKRSIGDVISDLARQSLFGPAETPKTRNGIPLLTVRQNDRLVSLDLVNELRDETT